MKRVAILLLFLVIVGLVIAGFGYVPFRVSGDSLHVMSSQTSGWSVVPSVQRRFDWRWELLIPRNAEIYSFADTERSFTVSVNETLPSADLYGSVLEGPADFRMRVVADVIVDVDPASLPTLAQEGLRPDTYDEWFARVESGASVAVSALIRSMARGATVSTEVALLDSLGEEIADELNNRFPALLFVSVSTREVDVPDMSLYALARETYRDVQNARRVALREVGAELALQEAAQASRMELFAQYGEILERYPVLIDYLSIVAETGGDPLGLGDLSEIAAEE